MKRHTVHVHIGLRTIKTALAVTLSLMLASLFGSYSPVYAGIGAILAVTRTVRDSLKQALTQYTGLVIGGVVGFLLILIFHRTPPWAVGLGIIAAITLCIRCKADFAASTACFIVLSACINTGDNVMHEMLYRLLDTTLGLTVGLGINILLKPYNNKPQILKLLGEIAGIVSCLVEECVVCSRYPDLTPFEKKLRQLEEELAIFRQLRFGKQAGRAQDIAFLEGLEQLAVRMYQELAAICFMDSFGIPNGPNRMRLEVLGIDLPDEIVRKCSVKDTTVLNFHLEKLLDARDFLLELLQ